MNSIIQERPIVFFDLETTGVNIMTDRIIEISVVKIHPNGEREVKTRLINPEMPIPEESSAIHGITDEDVKDAPTFRAISKNFFLFLEDCDLAGYNIIKFDIPMLAKEFSKVGLNFNTSGRKIIDVYSIFCRMEPRNLSSAYRFFCGKKMVDAHSAEADTLATVEIFEAQLAKYRSADPETFPEEVESFPEDLEGLHSFCCQFSADHIDPEGRFKWRNGEAVVGFGKNTGLSLKKVAMESPDFLKWILRSDFSQEVKNIAADALRGIFPSKDSPTGKKDEKRPSSSSPSGHAPKNKSVTPPPKKGLNSLGALDALNSLVIEEEE